MSTLKKRNVTLVSIAAVSLGFLAITSNHIETGTTLCATVLSGYFGFSTDYRSTPTPVITGETLLLVSVLIWAAAVLLLKPEVAVFALSIAITAIGGYFGYSHQERMSLPPLPPKHTNPN